MKVVINRRFGGFGLSPIATAAYYKKKGITATFYQPDGYDFRKSHRVRPENITGIMCYAFSKDLGEILNEWPEENGISLSCSDMPRDDADLVTTVEELGKLANTRFSFWKLSRFLMAFLGEYRNTTEWKRLRKRTGLGAKSSRGTPFLRDSHTAGRVVEKPMY